MKMKNPNNNSVFSQVIDILDEDSIKSTNEKLLMIILLMEILFILYLEIIYLFYLIIMVLSNIHIINLVLIMMTFQKLYHILIMMKKPKGDENFKSYFEMETDIEDESNWEDIYGSN